MEVNFFIAFLFGILSFISPCVLPLVPGYLAIFSESEKDVKVRLFGSIQFSLGFSIVFISLAAIATNIGSFFSRNSESLSRASGIIIILFGHWNRAHSNCHIISDCIYAVHTGTSHRTNDTSGFSIRFER